MKKNEINISFQQKTILNFSYKKQAHDKQKQSFLDLDIIIYMAYGVYVFLAEQF